MDMCLLCDTCACLVNAIKEIKFKLLLYRVELTPDTLDSESNSRDFLRGIIINMINL